VNDLNTTLLVVIVGLMAVLLLFIAGMMVLVRNNTTVMNLSTARMTDLSVKVDVMQGDVREIKGSVFRTESGVNMLVQRPRYSSPNE